MSHSPNIGEAATIFALGVFYGALFLFTPVWGPRLIFLGLGSSVPSARRSPSFSITDSLVLIVLLSGANGMAAQWRSEVSASWLAFLFTATNVLVASVWFLGLQAMQRYAIRRQRERLLYQLILNPLAIFGSSGAVISLIMLFNVLAVVFERLGDASLVPVTAVGVLSFAASLLTCFLARRGLIGLLARERGAGH